MKKAMLFALTGVILSLVFAGCTPTQETPSTNPGSMSKDTEAPKEASAEKVKCDMCGQEFDKSATKEVDGKVLCLHCVEMNDGKHDAEMIDDANGHQVATKDAVQIDGKMYCKECAAKMRGGDVPAEAGTEGHGEKPADHAGAESHEGHGH